MALTKNIVKHPIVSILILVLAAALMFIGHQRGETLQMLAYLAAMLSAAIITDFLVELTEARSAEFTIKSPVKEFMFLLTIQITILIISLVRFQAFSDWQHTGIFVKLPMLVLMILFVYPVALLTVYLFKWKYSLRDLGFRLRGIWLGLPVIFIIGLTSYLVGAEKIAFGEMYRTMGLIPMILTGFLVAAIPEELTRVLVQTRIGKFFDNHAAGWLLASIIWALLHLPNFWAQDSHDFVSAFNSVVAITPIGLLWGYITHRTKSILPAVVVHGTNLWSLQNF